jgi:hypothetical protein
MLYQCLIKEKNVVSVIIDAGVKTNGIRRILGQTRRKNVRYAVSTYTLIGNINWINRSRYQSITKFIYSIYAVNVGTTFLRVMLNTIKHVEHFLKIFLE